MPTPLHDRRVLVTGATSGIGFATALALADVGASLAVMARTTDDVERVVAELPGETAPGHLGVPCDVVDADAVAAALAEIDDTWGGLDAVVNAAGVVRPGGITETGPRDWRATFEVNVLGLLHVTHAALPLLRRAELADVVNISSMSGRRRASVAMTVYSASKFAVHVISDGLREELQPDGIRVTTIAPGYVQTPIFDDVADDALRQQYQQALDHKGLDPAAVAAQVAHALSQPAGVDLLEIALLSTRQ